MRTPVFLPSLLLATSVLIASLSGCATDPAFRDPTAELRNPDVITRTEANGDVVTEYRVAGQLQVIKVTPVRGPTYYLTAGDRDGVMDGDSRVSPVYWKLFEWD